MAAIMAPRWTGSECDLRGRHRRLGGLGYRVGYWIPIWSTLGSIRGAQRLHFWVQGIPRALELLQDQPCNRAIDILILLIWVVTLASNRGTVVTHRGYLEIGTALFYGERGKRHTSYP